MLAQLFPNHSYSDGFSHTDQCNKDGIVHYYILRGQRSEFPKYDVFKSLKISAKSVDPDEMQHYAAFHLGLHCLPKYPFWGFPVYNGLRNELIFFCFNTQPRNSYRESGTIYISI